SPIARCRCKICSARSTAPWASTSATKINRTSAGRWPWSRAGRLWKRCFVDSRRVLLLHYFSSPFQVLSCGGQKRLVFHVPRAVQNLSCPVGNVDHQLAKTHSG